MNILPNPLSPHNLLQQRRTPLLLHPLNPPINPLPIPRLPKMLHTLFKPHFQLTGPVYLNPFRTDPLHLFQEKLLKLYLRFVLLINIFDVEVGEQCCGRVGQV